MWGLKQTTGQKAIHTTLVFHPNPSENFYEKWPCLFCKNKICQGRKPTWSYSIGALCKQESETK